MKGWMKLSNSIVEWEWFRKPYYLQVLTCLCRKANEYRGDHWECGMTVHYGQCVYTQEQLAEDATGSKKGRQKIRTILDNLEKTGYLTKESTKGLTKGLTNSATLITLSDKAFYWLAIGAPNQRVNQESNQGVNHKLTKGQPSTNQPIRNNNINILNNNNHENSGNGAGAPPRARVHGKSGAPDRQTQAEASPWGSKEEYDKAAEAWTKTHKSGASPKRARAKQEE